MRSNVVKELKPLLVKAGIGLKVVKTGEVASG